ncbi:TraR/DksA C4-type zinc finger protein [Actinoplanes sp. NPDC026623]|uniref:TraR/DksA family transcriptional regulator n=1 Tax=Actinoplanes sp. NPDC026623 TaxID=3155610 RepID=UPI0033E25699
MSVETNVPDHGHFAQMRASLSAEFAMHTARLTEFTQLDADTGDPGEAYQRAALLAVTRRALEQITGALNRIAEGTYGRCEKCGTSIPAERLQLLPHAQRCVPCQQRHDG